MSKDTKDHDDQMADQSIAEWPRKISGLDAAKKKEIFERLESAVEVNHNLGMNCAERTFASIYDTFAKWTDLPKEIIRIASGFGGGGASTSYGLCGAVTGALMGLGLFWGRVDPMEFFRTIGFNSVEEAQANPQQSAQFSRIFSAYMKEFENTFGSLICGELVKDYLDSSGFYSFEPTIEQERKDFCKRFTKWAPSQVVTMILEGQEKGIKDLTMSHSTYNIQ